MDKLRAWPWLAGFLLLLAVLPTRFNVNEFSMHHFYKNRLVQCYLGAGNAGQRNPNPFTGFDPNDDIPIAKHRQITGPHPDR